MFRACWTNLRRFTSPIATVGLLLAASTLAIASESAREILDRARVLDDTERRWSDRVQEFEFRIHGKLGDRTRTLRLYEQRASSREHKVLVRILAPADVRDLGFLQFTHSGAGSEQWLYLPQFKRVRRVTGSIKSERFVGSDVTHDDLDLITALPGWTEGDAAATLWGEEILDGVACHVIDLEPKRPEVAYKRIRLWLGQDDLFARRLELFGDGTALTKTISQSEVRKVGAIPVAHRVSVETLSEGTATLIVLKETRFDVAIPDQCFSQATLTDVSREVSTCRPRRSS